MQISSRFTIALHIFACVETFKDEYKVTSDFLAGSINTNPRHNPPDPDAVEKRGFDHGGPGYRRY